MRVVVYGIAKNEAKHIQRFMQMASEADAVVITDTGSTDDTVSLLRSFGATVHEIALEQFRFDAARNTALGNAKNLEADIYVSIDLDEIFAPGWRALVEKAWTSNTSRLRYPIWWIVNEDGTCGGQFSIEKIHNKNHYWKGALHEVLLSDELQSSVVNDVAIINKHLPDKTKSREQYLSLMELAVSDEPDNIRNAHYLGREYMYHGQKEKAITELKRHLSLPGSTWAAERSASMRFISNCCDDIDESIAWCMRACAESLTEREPWVQLAKHGYTKRDWPLMFFAADRALKINDHGRYISEPFAWGAEPWDLLALAAWNLGLFTIAKAAGREAVKLAPNDSRLQKNLDWYETK